MSVDVFGKSLRAPLLIAAMTGGTDKARSINRELARIAEERAQFTMLDVLRHNPPRSLQEDFAADPNSTIPAFIDTGATLIDKSNVDAFLAAPQSHK